VHKIPQPTILRIFSFAIMQTSQNTGLTSLSSCRFLTERTTPLSTTLEEIQQSTRVDDDEGGGVGGNCRRWSGHQSRDEHGRDGEASVDVDEKIPRVQCLGFNGSNKV
jgi:hypothetical protein